ncbi:hypothetical protein DUNSADRAFT_14550 [Dunaliella salina]|uniref:7,8-dihydroneopterin aldolase n=1 Tax=Dunaliella salina TaxID=3046 RepID=A0ABQ7G759_DUNSA|nr:hypothetical protein DUNSADRAFT_14550 [Dunaliella salina]|eukprot:KAF5830453.1 hypothetical protein DUNSADRAFT_14550 [Dunaliella salina]
MSMQRAGRRLLPNNLIPVLPAPSLTSCSCSATRSTGTHQPPFPDPCQHDKGKIPGSICEITHQGLHEPDASEHRPVVAKLHKQQQLAGWQTATLPAHPFGAHPFTLRNYSSPSLVTSRDREAQDAIHIKGARFYGYHGVLPEENIVGQPFLVDLVLHCDLREAGSSDDLQTTVSYAEVFSDVQAIMEGPPFSLLERAAHEIARKLLVRHAPRVRQVQATISKVHIPKLSAAVTSVGVSVTRRPEDFGMS